MVPLFRLLSRVVHQSGLMLRSEASRSTRPASLFETAPKGPPQGEAIPGRCRFLNRIGSARNGDGAGARDIDQAQRLHQLDEGVHLVGGADHLEHEAVVGGVHRPGAEDLGDAQGFDPLVAGARHLHQGQLAADMGPLDGEVRHLVHRHQAAQLVLDLLDDHAGAAGHDGDARQLFGGIDLGHGQAFDVVAAAREQPDDAGEHAGLVVDEDGDGVAGDFLMLGHVRVPLDQNHAVFFRAGLVHRPVLRPQHHLVVGHAGHDHREAVLGGVGAQLGDHRAIDGDHLLDQVVHLRGLLGAQAHRAEGLGQLDEIGMGVHVAFGIAAAVDQLLPLADHAHVLVVQDEHLHRQPVLGQGGQLLDVHLDRRFAGDVDDQGAGMGHLHAHGRGQAVAHGAQPARGHPVVGLLEAEMLGRPHLVLADLGADVGIAVLGQLVQALDGVLRLDQLVGILVVQAVARAPLVDLAPPRLQRLVIDAGLPGLPHLDHVFQDVGGVADHRQVDRHVLVDGTGVDVDVDLLGIRREGVEPPGDAVVEAGADIDHQIAAVHGQVGLVGAVHAEHAQRLRIRAREAAQAHQGLGAGEAGHAHELGQQLAGRGAGIDHAAADVEQRPLGVGDHVDRLLDGLDVALHRRLVFGLELARPLVLALGLDHVLGQVDQHRAGTAGAGDVEGLVHGAGQIVDVLDQVIVLGARPGDAGDVGFLEGVVADQAGRHLAGEAHQRHRVAQGIGQAGDGVGGAGARGDQHAADLAGGAGVALGGMHGGLLVTDQHVLEAVLLEQLVVDGQYRAARIAEEHLDALVDQSLQKDFRAGQRILLCHCRTLIVKHPKRARHSRNFIAQARGREGHNLSPR
ncbi:conserved hypothetical protein [Magnetospirillum sp. UT-4]|nr:conserved hypothetical protein [Magnetospirillum sp. UT-4]